MIFGIWLPYIQRQLDLSGWVTKMNFAFCGTLDMLKTAGHWQGKSYTGPFENKILSFKTNFVLTS